MRELDDTLSSPSSPDRRPGRPSGASAIGDRRGALAQVIPRRARVTWWLGLILAVGFAALVTPTITAERWLLRFDIGTVVEGQPARFTVRAPILAGAAKLRVGGGLVVARGELATRDEAVLADAIARAMPRGAPVYAAWFALTFVLAAMFSHHLRRSATGRLVRIQVVSLAVIAALAVVVKLVLLSTAASRLVVPVAVLAIVAALALDRIVGLASGVLAALVVSVLAPFEIGVAILLVVQAATAGLVITERPRAAAGRRWIAALGAGGSAILCTGAAYLLLTYLSSGPVPRAGDALHSAWLAAVIGPAIAAVIAVPLLPLYQRMVGEITEATLIALEDLGHPLLRQIAEKSPGTWQHSLMMANMAEIAANAIGASGRLARVGAYFHDLGKSLQAKYFIENLEAGETSLHDQLPPEASCAAIFAHVTEGIVAARKAGLHERVVDFMHMHHGNGVLEYFWAKCREQGNPHGFTVAQFRYPGHPPQTRETAVLAICDAVEAASRTLSKPDPAAIDGLVQRIVYGKLHLGQLDDSGLSMSDLRRISDSLCETIRQANHGRTAAPRPYAEHDASASAAPYSATGPRLDSLDRKPARATPARAVAAPRSLGDSDDAFAATADIKDATRPRTLEAAPPTPRSDAEHALTAEGRAPTAVAAPGLQPGPSGHPPVPSDPAQLAAALASIVSRVSAAPFGGPVVEADGVIAPRPSSQPRASGEPRSSRERPPGQPGAHATVHAGRTAPALPVLEPSDDRIDPPSPWSGPEHRTTPRDAPWSSALATRIDAALDADEWSPETPVVAPTEAELRILIGQPDPTRQQPPADIAILQRHAAALGHEAPRRSPHPTAEVDPDDIEAAIELAPPARRPTYANLIGARSKKPPNQAE